MARTVHIHPDEVLKAKLLRDQASTVAEYRKALSVLLVAEHGFDADRAADALGVSRRTVFRDRDKIRSQDGSRQNTWGGRRNASMTIEEEREFLAQWDAQAIQGGVLTVSPIHAALVKKLGHDIPMATTYRLLARHGWRKVQPDTKHPKGDPDAQEEFKKNSRKRWLPPA